MRAAPRQSSASFRKIPTQLYPPPPEVIEHRAEHTRRWAHFRHSLLADDIKHTIHRFKKREGGVLAATRARSILGAAVLFFDKRQRYEVIEDIVVGERRHGSGAARKLIASAIRAMTDAKLEHVILESGIRNESAPPDASRRTLAAKTHTQKKLDESAPLVLFHIRPAGHAGRKHMIL